MIDLPETPGPAEASAALIDFGGFLNPVLGGPDQRIDRLGNRFKLSVTMPPLRHLSDGRVWVQRLIRGKTEGVRMPFPLLGFDPGAPGAPVVAGASQSGRFLNLSGLTPNYQFVEGQPFSVLTGSRHHLYFVDSPTIASNTGTITLPISPMLRLSPANGDTVFVAKPMIEGFVLGNEQAWQMSIGNFDGLSFEIREAR